MYLVLDTNVWVNAFFEYGNKQYMKDCPIFGIGCQSKIQFFKRVNITYVGSIQFF